MLQVFLAKNRLLHRYAPINAKRLVLDIDAAISLRMIELVAFVLEDGSLGENGETMSEATRDKKLTMIVFCQFYCYMVAECRGAFADVNGYVKYCTFDAAHELTLCIWHALIVKTTHHTVGRHRFVVLHEVDTMPKDGRYFLVKLSLREALEEVAAGVFEYTWLNDEHAGD